MATLRTETTGVHPQFDHTDRLERDCQFAPAEMGQVRAREVAEADVRTFELVWEDAKPGERHRLEQAWADARGPILEMDYTPVGDVDANALAARFVADSLEWERSGPREYRMRVLVEEVL